jgi:hypothetical protein
MGSTLKGDSMNCFNTLNSIPELNSLSSGESEEFNRYSELVNILWLIRNGTLDLDSLTANQLHAVAESESVPGTIARNILVAGGLTEYNEPIYISEVLKYSLFNPGKTINASEAWHRLKIFPNPAKDYIILCYDLSGLQGNFNIEIINSEGIVLIRQKLSGTINQAVISTESLPSSSYALRLNNKTSCLESTKLIILK